MKQFRQLQRLTKFDELNVISTTKLLYEQLKYDTVKAYYVLIGRLYPKAKRIEQDIVEDLFEMYNPVTKYVFNHEVERKQARLAESILSSTNISDELKLGLRLWVRQITQYAIDLTDKVMLLKYSDNGIIKVVWFTRPDEWVCYKCRALHGNVYDIDKVPPKPHYNCRCYVKPLVRENVKTLKGEK